MTRKHKWIDDTWRKERVSYRYHRGQPNYKSNKPNVPITPTKSVKRKM